MPAPDAPRWDLFCRVVDNFGDAGTAWRLARQLVAEHRLAVTLWIDAPSVLGDLAGVPVAAGSVTPAGVMVRRLERWMPGEPLPAVVVDVLGGGVPGGLVEQMRTAAAPPRWFVVEYLSAEGWVEAAHGLPSPHPGTGVSRRFWFPGFTQATGGLLRERDLLARRDAFRAESTRAAALWRSLGLPELGDALRVSLFCYPDAPLADLLDAWAGGSEPIVGIVPGGVATDALARWAGGAGWPRPVRRGALTLHPVPFVSQDRYDEILWACDFNLVRGEDSFVRAQWAGRPFAWNIYPQEARAHAVKLDAFLGRYAAGLPPAPHAALTAFSRAWNGLAPAHALGSAWQALRNDAAALAAHAVAWSNRLAAVPDFADTLVRASREPV